MKQLFYDLETTGVKPHKHGVHQIAGIIVIDGTEKESFNIKMQPHPNAEITDQALKICGITKDDLENYQPMESAKKEFTKLISKYVNRYDKHDKFHLTGYNSRAFDDKFLRAFFEYNNDPYFGSYFWADSLDVLVLASYALRNEREKLYNFQLGTVAKYIGIDFDENEAHDALYDVKKTLELYKLLELL